MINGFGSKVNASQSRVAGVLKTIANKSSVNRGSTLVMNAAPEGKAPEGMSYDIPDFEDGEAVEEEPKPKFTMYAWFVLAIVALVRVMVQWQRSIFSFAYGYTGTGLLKGDPFYELSSAYPQLAGNYGTLTGLAYTMPFAIFGLFVGKFTEKANRKWSLAVVIALAASTMGLTGACNSFFVLGAMRVMHGMVNSATNPLSFSLIGDYFPPDKRATANSIIHSG